MMEELREPTEVEREQDIKFLTHILFEIRDYARSAGNPDIYSVKCKRCNDKIGKVSNNYADLSDDVVNAWNRRTSDESYN